MSALLRRNIGPVDRAIRIGLGVGLLALTVVGPATPWGLIGLVPLVTAFIGSCPLYSILGISTCRVGRTA